MEKLNKCLLILLGLEVRLGLRGSYFGIIVEWLVVIFYFFLDYKRYSYNNSGF